MINRLLFLFISLLFLLQSCVTKKEVIYFQGAKYSTLDPVIYESVKIQPNDILNISVSALVPETAIPYNKQTTTNNTVTNIELLKLQGYLVSHSGAIVFPVLGGISVAGKTMEYVEKEIEEKLEKGGHLLQPIVSIRLLNAKVTVLGEVNNPGTFSFSEQNLTLPQALGLAGDLTINGKRTDVTLVREDDGERVVKLLDLTDPKVFNSPFYNIRPNDTIIVSPNTAKVKSAGIVGNIGTVLTFLSIILTSVVLITNTNN
ncbi:polysaccharide biosynthesis/export family protein [Aquimarina agarivorans]|uniref:polysaccharide biosynthesis/export family protein n=1 Tax=Aquimarina agarivorans TaxID=980584 RepID=UPI000248E856|nr:polysaccharide biosynthesis/export family protein [Aquimarina agarivorans]